jgi:hypothetical protein
MGRQSASAASRAAADGPRVPSGTNLIFEAADRAGTLARGHHCTPRANDLAAFRENREASAVSAVTLRPPRSGNKLLQFAMERRL